LSSLFISSPLKTKNPASRGLLVVRFSEHKQKAPLWQTIKEVKREKAIFLVVLAREHHFDNWFRAKKKPRLQGS